MSVPALRVLVVDDDFRVARLHASYVGQVQGFEVVGTAQTIADAIHLAVDLRPGLVLLDEYLEKRGVTPRRKRVSEHRPVRGRGDDGQRRRGPGRRTPRDCGRGRQLRAQTVPACRAGGSVDRLPTLLGGARGGGELDQTGVDRALQVLRTADTPVAHARKGRSPVTSDAIVEVLRSASDALTAVEVAEATGVSRATAQRYLSDLARDGRVQLTLRYGPTGRPEHCFEWLGRRR